MGVQHQRAYQQKVDAQFLPTIFQRPCSIEAENKFLRLSHPFEIDHI